jgi:hypothetical protein
MPAASAGRLVHGPPGALAVSWRSGAAAPRDQRVDLKAPGRAPASVVKAMLLVTYLDLPSVRDRALGPPDMSVLAPMIQASDNDAAQRIFDTVGQGGLQAPAHRVGMTRFATNPVCGETSITARDQTRFFLHVDGSVARRQRSYAMRLLRSIIPSERWGVGELSLPGWKRYFKGGWGYGTGLLDHQVVLLTRGCARVSIAVLTMYDGSHAYGKATLQAVFSRLLRRFPTRFAQRRRVHHRGGATGSVQWVASDGRSPS